MIHTWLQLVGALNLSSSISDLKNSQNVSSGDAAHKAGTISLSQVIPPPITGAVPSMAMRMADLVV
jgi:hypothetical protein